MHEMVCLGVTKVRNCTYWVIFAKIVSDIATTFGCRCDEDQC